jgi:hypothetical protein
MASMNYWDHNVDLNVTSWFPFGKDYKPVSINAYHSPALEEIAKLSLDLDSELFCLTSLKSGNVGSLLRDNMIIPGKDSKVELGFTMVFGYSSRMEALLFPLLKEVDGVSGGITACSLWNDDMYLDSFKAIILVSSNPLFDEDGFFSMLVDAMRQAPMDGLSMSYFAEKFGYTRFFIPFETDNTTSLQISRYLYEMEFDETRRSVGPSPEKMLPELVGLMLKEE